MLCRLEFRDKIAKCIDVKPSVASRYECAYAISFLFFC